MVHNQKRKRGDLPMAEVKVTDSFEKAMRVFKKQCQREGFLMQIKEKRYYSKPSEIKRRKKAKSKRA
ncbi:MAG: 30S ribosomal protein S21 [Candidatus Omnitrophica bacterium]|nr:30S ribosomal protein S21 [Candidatus Omnitrophota bacterium]